MKYLISLLFLSLVFVFGCSENQIDVSKENQSAEKTVIKLPLKSGLNSEIFSVTQKINGIFGGSIPYNHSYTSSNGNLVQVESVITFLPGSFLGSRNITVSLDGNIAALNFDPGMVFLLPATLNATISGLDLSAYTGSSNVDFYFIADNGALTQVNHDGVSVDNATGALSVTNAKINHFSRYGWAK